MIPLCKIVKRMNTSSPPLFIELPSNYDKLFYEFHAVGWEEPEPQEYPNPQLLQQLDGHFSLLYSGELIPAEAIDGEFNLTILCTVKTHEYNKGPDYSPLAFLGKDRIYGLVDKLLGQAQAQNNGRLAFPVELPEGYKLNEFQAALQVLETSGWQVQFPNYGSSTIATILIEGPFQ